MYVSRRKLTIESEIQADHRVIDSDGTVIAVVSELDLVEVPLKNGVGAKHSHAQAGE